MQNGAVLLVRLMAIHRVRDLMNKKGSVVTILCPIWVRGIYMIVTTSTPATTTTGTVPLAHVYMSADGGGGSRHLSGFTISTRERSDRADRTKGEA